MLLKYQSLCCCQNFAQISKTKFTKRLLVRQYLRPGCKSRRDWKFSRVWQLGRQQVPICELHEFPLDNALSSSSKFFLGYHSLLYVIKVGDNWKFSHVESRQQDPICELHEFPLDNALLSSLSKSFFTTAFCVVCHKSERKLELLP